MKYDKMIALMAHWASFETAFPDGTMSEFGEWLYRKQTQALKGEKKLPNAHDEEQPIDTQISKLLARMNRYSRLYVKKALDGLPIYSLDEFMFLASIAELGKPRKSTLIQHNLMEMTTGVEIIKRLLANGLVVEMEDITDRRSKRLDLTEQGRRILGQGWVRIHRMARLTTATLEIEQKNNLIDLLLQLDAFHWTIFQKDIDKSLAEISQIYL